MGWGPLFAGVLFAATLSKRHVARAQAAGVVSGEADVDAVVQVRPLGMMVRLLRKQRDPCHEGEGLGEVIEGEDAAEGVALVVSWTISATGSTHETTG